MVRAPKTVEETVVIGVTKDNEAIKVKKSGDADSKYVQPEHTLKEPIKHIKRVMPIAGAVSEQKPKETGIRKLTEGMTIEQKKEFLKRLKKNGG